MKQSTLVSASRYKGERGGDADAPADADAAGGGMEEGGGADMTVNEGRMEMGGVVFGEANCLHEHKHNK